MTNKTKKTILVIGVQLIIAFFFVLGADRTNHLFYILYQSYFADVFLPFGFYFLLSLEAHETQVLNTWWKKVITVFTLCSISETLQYFGVYALATVFDPLDFAMYGAGILLAALVDKQLFARTIPFWDDDTTS